MMNKLSKAPECVRGDPCMRICLHGYGCTRMRLRGGPLYTLVFESIFVEGPCKSLAHKDSFYKGIIL
jgi:hypothetical protein